MKLAQTARTTALVFVLGAAMSTTATAAIGFESNAPCQPNVAPAGPDIQPALANACFGLVDAVGACGQAALEFCLDWSNNVGAGQTAQWGTNTAAQIADAICVASQLEDNAQNPQDFGGLNGLLGTTNDILSWSHDLSAYLDEAALEAQVVACPECWEDLAQVAAGGCADGGAVEVPVYDTSFPSNPYVKDCSELEDRLAQAKGLADSIDCSAGLAAVAAAEAAATAAQVGLDAATDLLSDAATAAADAQAAYNDALAAADDAAAAMADLIESTVFVDGVSVGTNPGGYDNSIGVGGTGTPGSLTIFFDGSSTSIDTLTTLFATDAFQAARAELEAARKGLKPAAEEAQATLQALFAAQADWQQAAADRAAAQAALAAAQAANAACQSSQQAADAQVAALEAALAECLGQAVKATSKAVASAQAATHNAAKVVETGQAVGAPGAGEAAGLTQNAAEKAEEAAELEESGDLDGARDAADEAKELATQAATAVNLGCKPSQGPKYIDGDSYSTHYTLLGFENASLHDALLSQGATLSTQASVMGKLNHAIDLLLATPPTNGPDSVATGSLSRAAHGLSVTIVQKAYGIFQGAAVKAIRGKVAEIQESIKGSAIAYWIEMELEDRWSVQATATATEQSVYVCENNRWTFSHYQVVTETTYGNCVELGNSIVRRDFPVLTGTLAEGIASLLGDLVDPTGQPDDKGTKTSPASMTASQWVTGVCPGH